MGKKIDEGGYLEFLEYFDRVHPALRSKFPAKIEWSMLTVPYGVWRPDAMDIETFDEFRRIELEWLVANGHIPEYEGTRIFKIVIDGTVTIHLNQVVKVIKVTDNSTNIIVNVNGVEVPYCVVGNIDWVNSKLGIVSHPNQVPQNNK